MKTLFVLLLMAIAVSQLAQGKTCVPVNGEDSQLDCSNACKTPGCQAVVVVNSQQELSTYCDNVQPDNCYNHGTFYIFVDRTPAATMGNVDET